MSDNPHLSEDWVCVVEHFTVDEDGRWIPVPCPGRDPHSGQVSRQVSRDILVFLGWFLAGFLLLVFIDPLGGLP